MNIKTLTEIVRAYVASGATPPGVELRFTLNLGPATYPNTLSIGGIFTPDSDDTQVTEPTEDLRVEASTTPAELTFYEKWEKLCDEYPQIDFHYSVARIRRKGVAMKVVDVKTGAFPIVVEGPDGRRHNWSVDRFLDDHKNRAY